MSEAGHRRWEEEVAAYALGALDPREAAEVEAHLAGCERCRADLRWLEPAVDVIPESVAQASPPARLREDLMRVVSTEARDAGPRTSTTGWRSWMLRPATALAVATVAVAGVVGYSLRGEEEAPVTAEVPVEAAPQAEGAVAVLELEGDAGSLRVRNVPQLEGEQVYQVWVADGHKVERSAAFRPDPSGTASVAIPAGLEGADEVMVTREPRLGAKDPSSDPILQAELE